MIESDLANYLEEFIDTSFTVGRRLPSAEEDINIFSVNTAVNNYYNTALSAIQISVRATEIDRARDLVDQVVSNIRGFYGTLGTSNVTMFIENIGGELFEDDGRTIHIPILVNVKS
jgi:hypothetical protein